MKHFFAIILVLGVLSIGFNNCGSSKNSSIPISSTGTNLNSTPNPFPGPIPNVWPAPSFTANTATMLNVNVGTTINYQWAFPGASSVQSTVTVDVADPSCGFSQGKTIPWVATNPTDSVSGTVGACQKGRTYQITILGSYPDGSVSLPQLVTVYVSNN